MTRSIVGGGPAGSTCARTLRRAGWNVVVARSRDISARQGLRRLADARRLSAARARSGRIPRRGTHPAGDHRVPDGRPRRRAQTDQRHSRLIETRYPHVVSYAIRRCEFDDFLLRRAGVRVLERHAGDRAAAERRPLDRQRVAIEAPVVIGAGGHFCPVARHLQGSPDTIAARRGEGSGVSAVSDRGRGSRRPARPSCSSAAISRATGGACGRATTSTSASAGETAATSASHVRNFIALLEASGTLTPGTSLRWRGHAYFASGVGPRPLVGAGMLIAGDGAGLAYPESGEGIHPAIASGRLAAETLIAADGRYSVEDLQPYAEALGRLHPPARRPAAPIRIGLSGDWPRAARVSPLHESTCCSTAGS